ncbi:MAG: DUF5683 domain-containing protein [Bacteroidota bacterium]
MLKPSFYSVFLIFIYWNSVFGQEQINDIIIQSDSIIISQKIDPLGPSRAAFYSAILPGLGQAYNKKYWKIPIVYAALGTGIYFYLSNRKQLDRYQTAYKQRLAGFSDEFDGIDPNPYISDEGLIRAQNIYRKNKDLSLFITIGLYALNIIEANVDAHLNDKVFNKDLSFKPSIFINPVDNSTVAGVYIKYDF